MTTMSSRQFNQDTGGAKKAAESGPVLITDRGTTTHVLLRFEDYRQMTEKSMTLLEALAMPGTDDIEFDPPRSRETSRGVDLS